MCGTGIISARVLGMDANSSSSSSELNASVGSGSSFGSRRKVSFDSELIVREEEAPQLPLRPGMRIVADKTIDFDDMTQVKIGSQGRVVSVSEHSIEVQMDDCSRFDAALDDVSAYRGLHRGTRIRTKCSLAGLDKTEIPQGAEGRITKATCPNGVVEIVIDRITKTIEMEKPDRDSCCGVVFTNTLQIHSTDVGTAADDSGLTSHRGWTVVKINGKVVTTNTEVTNLCASSAKLTFEIARDSVPAVVEEDDILAVGNLKRGVTVRLVRKQKTSPRQYIEPGTVGMITSFQDGMYSIQTKEGLTHRVEPVNVVPLPDASQTPSSSRRSSFWSKLTSQFKKRKGSQ